MFVYYEKIDLNNIIPIHRDIQHFHTASHILYCLQISGIICSKNMYFIKIFSFIIITFMITF